MAVRCGRDEGAALVVVLLLGLLLGALGTSLSLVVDMDTLMVSNHRTGLVTRHVAEGIADVVVHELAQSADWTTVLNGTSVSSLRGGLVLPPSMGSEVVDSAALTTALQQETYGGDPWGANTPRWRLHAHGVPGVDLPAVRLTDRAYVLVWVADDVGEGDGDPWVDTNETVIVRARAMGPARSQSDAQVVVTRVAPGVVGRVSSRVMW